MPNLAFSYGAAARQRTVRQKTTMAKHGTLPEFIYQRQCVASDEPVTLTTLCHKTNWKSCRKQHAPLERKRMTKKSLMSSIPTVTKRLKGKMLREEIHSFKEKLEALQLFSLVPDLDLAELFASTFLVLIKGRNNSITGSLRSSLVARRPTVFLVSIARLPWVPPGFFS